MEEEKINLKTLSILTLILVPLIPSVVLFSTFVGKPAEPLPGLAYFFLVFVFGSVFAGILATIQLQLKRKLMEEEGFLVRASPLLSVILSLTITIIYLGYMITQEKREIRAYGYGYVFFSRYTILLLYLPLLSIYTAILVNRGKKDRFINFLTNLCYAGYALSPVLFLIFLFVGGI